MGHYFVYSVYFLKYNNLSDCPITIIIFRSFNIVTYQHCTTHQPKLNLEGIQIVQFLNILMMKTEFRATLVKIHCHNNSLINLLSNDMKNLLEKVLNIHGLGEHMHVV